MSPAVGTLGCGLDRLLVISDDISLPLGTLRLREKGSAGGHKGLASIIQELGTEAFPRLRIGVGSPVRGQDAAAYVLDRFSPAEEDVLPDVVRRAADAVEAWLGQGAARAMADYNN